MVAQAGKPLIYGSFLMPRRLRGGASAPPAGSARLRTAGPLSIPIGRAGWLRRYVAAVVRAWSVERTQVQLSRLDDRLLADIGLTRADLDAGQDGAIRPTQLHDGGPFGR
ncbi:hypothetical protein GCM10009099_18950 [Caenispirillum bisanense]